MRTEENPLDLNNFPEDYSKKTYEDSSTSAAAGVYRKKKNGAKEDEKKVYECRFCSLKFCKSQALGGHMNRHRLERETETLNKARHLVFNNDLAPPPPHLAHVTNGQTINRHGGYHQAAGAMVDSSLPFRTSMYPTRLFPTSSPSPQAASYTYASPQRFLSSTQYPPPPLANEYFLGHVLSSNESNYTCIGAPVGHAFPTGRGSVEGPVAGETSLLRNQEEGLDWGGRR